jgi:hypothetical protein
MPYFTFHFFIGLFLIYKINGQTSRSDRDVQCIKENSYWESIVDFKNSIPDPNRCLKISDDCCHIRIEYQYGPIPFDNSYCFSMTGKPSDWIKKFSNFYKDELMWYANYTYDNYEKYTEIGNNLNYVYYENYSCYETPEFKEYSTYNISKCALFNQTDGGCLVTNDEDNFSNFVENIYKNLTSCKDGSDVCRGYLDPNTANNTSLLPLFDVLKKSLIKNTTDGDIVQESHINDKSHIPFYSKPCQPLPLVSITLKCPDAYLGSNPLIRPYNILILILGIILLHF